MCLLRGEIKVQSNGNILCVLKTNYLSINKGKLKAAGIFRSFLEYIKNSLLCTTMKVAPKSCSDDQAYLRKKSS